MLSNYFLAFGWVRSWSIGWALADRITTIASFSVSNVDATFHDNITQMGGIAQLVSSLLYIGAPILLAILFSRGAAALGSLLGFAGLSIGAVVNTGVRVAQGAYGIMRGR